MFLFDQRILSVDENDIIMTGRAGEPPTRYSFEESLNKVDGLRNLYDSVELKSLTLSDIHLIKYLQDVLREL